MNVYDLSLIFENLYREVNQHKTLDFENKKKFISVPGQLEKIIRKLLVS